MTLPATARLAVPCGALAAAFGAVAACSLILGPESSLDGAYGKQDSTAASDVSVVETGDAGPVDAASDTPSEGGDAGPSVDASLDGQATCVAQVAAGGATTCAIRKNGLLYCWGQGASGQLGNGVLDATSPTPAQVVGLAPVTHVSVGAQHVCAIDQDGGLWCWGSNGDGELGVTTAVGAVATPVRPSFEGGVREVTANTSSLPSHQFTCIVDSNRNVWCWGDNLQGELGTNGPSGATPQVVPIDGGFTSVVAGTLSTFAFPPGGPVTDWGSNSEGQLGVGSSVGVGSGPPDAGETAPQLLIAPAAVSLLSTGEAHTCTIDDGGIVWCWGQNDDGQIGNGSDAATVPAAVAVLDGGVSIACGLKHTCAVRSDGTVWCWGQNANGQLGTGKSPTPTSSPAMVTLPPGIKFTHVVAGDFHTCALVNDDTVWCWGGNGSYQLGRSDTTSFVPEIVPVPCH